MKDEDQNPQEKEKEKTQRLDKIYLCPMCCTWYEKGLDLEHHLVRHHGMTPNHAMWLIHTKAWVFVRNRGMDV